MRARAFLAAHALLGAALCGCGDEERPAPAPPSSAPATEPETPAAAPYREELTPAEEEHFRTEVPLEPRDAPKAVGEVAPPFPALVEKQRTVIVFLRGEW